METTGSILEIPKTAFAKLILPPTVDVSISCLDYAALSADSNFLYRSSLPGIERHDKFGYAHRSL